MRNRIPDSVEWAGVLAELGADTTDDPLFRLAVPREGHDPAVEMPRPVIYQRPLSASKGDGIEAAVAGEVTLLRVEGRQLVGCGTATLPALVKRLYGGDSVQVAVELDEYELWNAENITGLKIYTRWRVRAVVALAAGMPAPFPTATISMVRTKTTARH